jgi:hypothetical protein
VPGHERPLPRLSQVGETALDPIPIVNQRRLLYETQLSLLDHLVAHARFTFMANELPQQPVRQISTPPHDLPIVAGPSVPSRVHVGKCSGKPSWAGGHDNAPRNARTSSCTEGEQVEAVSSLVDSLLRFRSPKI